jgi:hypothetical protein
VRVVICDSNRILREARSLLRWKSVMMTEKGRIIFYVAYTSTPKAIVAEVSLLHSLRQKRDPGIGGGQVW